MILTDEIKKAASALGKSLYEDEFMRPYLQTVAEYQSDHEAVELENQLYELYEELVNRQQAGEQISREETKAFSELRQRVQSHPLIARRNNALQMIKPFLADVADDISILLGVDYTTLVKSE